MQSTTWGSRTKRVSRTSDQPFRRRCFTPGLSLIEHQGWTHIAHFAISTCCCRGQYPMQHTLYLSASQNAMGKPDEEALTYRKALFWNNLASKKKSVDLLLKSHGPTFFIKHFGLDKFIKVSCILKTVRGLMNCKWRSLHCFQAVCMYVCVNACMHV